MCLEEGGVLEVVLLRGMTYLEGVYLGRALGQEESMKINYKMNFIKDSFQRFCKYFESFFHLLLLIVDIMHHTEMFISAFLLILKN